MKCDRHLLFFSLVYEEIKLCIRCDSKLSSKCWQCGPKFHLYWGFAFGICGNMPVAWDFYTHRRYNIGSLSLSFASFLVIFWKCVCLCLYAIVRFLVICLFFLHFLCVFFRCKFLWAMIIPFSNYSFFYIFFSLCLHPFRFLFFCIMHSAGKFAFYSFNRANCLYWGAIIVCWYLDRFNIRIGFVCL